MVKEPETGDKRLLEHQKKLLSDSVDAFASAMKARLLEKVDQGREGWSDPARKDEFYTSMLAHGAVVRHAAGHELDVANFAMFLWFLNNHSRQESAAPRLEQA